MLDVVEMARRMERGPAGLALDNAIAMNQLPFVEANEIRLKSVGIGSGLGEFNPPVPKFDPFKYENFLPHVPKQPLFEPPIGVFNPPLAQDPFPLNMRPLGGQKPWGAALVQNDDPAGFHVTIPNTNAQWPKSIHAGWNSPKEHSYGPSIDTPIGQKLASDLIGMNPLEQRVSFPYNPIGEHVMKEVTRGLRELPVPNFSFGGEAIDRINQEVRINYQKAAATMTPQELLEYVTGPPTTKKVTRNWEQMF